MNLKSISLYLEREPNVSTLYALLITVGKHALLRIDLLQHIEHLHGTLELDVRGEMGHEPRRVVEITLAHFDPIQTRLKRGLWKHMQFKRSSTLSRN